MALRSKTLDEAARAHSPGEARTNKDGRADFIAGAEWMREQFMLLGTDACSECDTGRSTIYATLNGLCTKCHYAKEREVP